MFLSLPITEIPSLLPFTISLAVKQIGPQFSHLQCHANLTRQTHKLNHTYVRATLGVSYASPAYYADRLCERGRCYLRPWFNPNEATRNFWNKRKHTLEKEATDKRRQKAAGSSKLPPAKGVKKTAEEKKAEKEAKEVVKNEVAKALREEVWKDIRPAFEKEPAPEATPAMRARFFATMYWM
jgi:eukaryotic translation initiation factor 2C